MLKPVVIIFLLFFSLNSFASSFWGSTADIDIKPAIGIPLAGYGAPGRRLPGFVDWFNRHPHAFFFRPSVGEIDPIRAKTMILRSGNKQVVFVSIDAIGVEFRLIDDLLKALKKYNVKRDELFVSGTHTHSGPGTLSRRIPLELVAVDLFKRENYNWVLNKTLQSIELAFARLQPVNVYKTSFATKGIQRNKWRKKDQEHYDKFANLLILKDQMGNNLGGMVNYAIHGGCLGSDNLHYSADIPGGIERVLEDLSAEESPMAPYSPTFVFMNGAEGDVGADGEGVAGIQKLSLAFKEQAREAFFYHRKPVAPFITSRTDKIWFGFPSYPMNKKKDENKPWKPFSFPLIGLMAQRAYISQVQIGDVIMLTWPGEPSTTLGFNLKDQMKKLSPSLEPWVLGLTNDYMSYFTTKEEFYEGAYDSYSSMYQWKGGVRVLEGHAKLFPK